MNELLFLLLNTLVYCYKNFGCLLPEKSIVGLVKISDDWYLFFLLRIESLKYKYLCI